MSGRFADGVDVSESWIRSKMNGGRRISQGERGEGEYGGYMGYITGVRGKESNECEQIVVYGLWLN